MFYYRPKHALDRNSPIPPSLSSLMLRAISCSGVRRISGVEWISSLREQMIELRTLYFQE